MFTALNFWDTVWHLVAFLLHGTPTDEVLCVLWRQAAFHLVPLAMHHWIVHSKPANEPYHIYSGTVSCDFPPFQCNPICNQDFPYKSRCYESLNRNTWQILLMNTNDTSLKAHLHPRLIAGHVMYGMLMRMSVLMWSKTTVHLVLKVSWPFLKFTSIYKHCPLCHLKKIKKTEQILIAKQIQLT